MQIVTITECRRSSDYWIQEVTWSANCRQLSVSYTKTLYSDCSFAVQGTSVWNSTTAEYSYPETSTSLYMIWTTSLRVRPSFDLYKWFGSLASTGDPACIRHPASIRRNTVCAIFDKKNHKYLRHKNSLRLEGSEVYKYCTAKKCKTAHIETVMHAIILEIWPINS